MLLLTLCVVAIVAFIILALHSGIWPAMTVAIMATMILLPRRLTNNSTVENTGIAGSAPELYTYSVVIISGALLLLMNKRRPIPRIFSPLVTLLLVGMILVWEQNSYVQAGLLQISLGIISWAIGSHIGGLILPGSHYERFFCIVILGIIGLETLIGLAQLAGVPINPLDPSTAALMGNRINGTMNHPNNLGKVLLFLIILLTPLTRSTDVQIRRRATWGTVLAFFPLALTGGRATFIAALVVVLMTGLLSRGVKGRFVMPFGVFLLVLPFLDTIWQRFEDDPEGGSRGYLTEIAFHQISQHPWTGLGPNSYVSIVGLSDALTATGLPVHNTFLLASAELGLPVTAALFFPFLFILVTAWKRRALLGYAGSSARTYIAAAPAWILVAATGWGMMSGSILPFWFFTFGYLAQQFMAPHKWTKSDSLVSESSPPWRGPPPIYFSSNIESARTGRRKGKVH